MAIDRANTVFFKNILFTDEDGDVVVADTATLTLSYPLNGAFEDEAVTLTLADLLWSGSWDSSVSDAGTVHGHLVGVSGAITCVKDFRFKLITNRANEAVNG